MGRKLNTWTATTFEEIEGWRKTRGLSRKAVAQLLGISGGTYYNWRRGDTAPNPGTQRRIRRILDEPVYDSHTDRYIIGPGKLTTEGDVGFVVQGTRMLTLARALGRPVPIGPTPRGLGLSGRSPPSLETEPTSAPETGRATTMNEMPEVPCPTGDKQIPTSGAVYGPGFRPVTEADIRLAVARLTSAALASGMKMSQEALPTMVRGLRQALT
jgi:transcriptional regulator with XRE-family HTH domain